MADITQILWQLEKGDREASEQLLQLVYDELKRLATAKLAQEKAGHLLQPTALVHEAWLRLMEVNHPPHFFGRRHFFGAAAEAMRRILVDDARRRNRLKRGSQYQRRELPMQDVFAQSSEVELLALDEALEKFQAIDALASELVKLRYSLAATTEFRHSSSGPRQSHRYLLAHGRGISNCRSLVAPANGYRLDETDHC